jgi:tetratricopeptide (TPR) repeat protein
MDGSFKKAIEAFQSGDLDRARTLAELELAGPSAPQANHLLGLVHCLLGDAGAGAVHLKRAADAEPANAAYRIMLMRALVDSGRANEVLEMPEPAPIRSTVALEEWRARAEAADAARDADAGMTAWSKVAAAAPKDWRAWANLGNSCAAVGKWSEANDALSKAAKLNPNDLAIRRNAASALLQLNRFEEAIVHLTAVAKSQPESAADQIALAHVLNEAQQYDEAIAAFEEARRLSGATVAIELGIGQALSAKLQFAQAEAAFGHAYELEPSNRTAVLQYGLVLDRNNKTEALAKLLDEARSNGLDEDSLSYLWAVLARREGRLQEAYEMLLRSEPHRDDPVAWYHLRAKLADRLGNPAEAFEAAAEMNRAALAIRVPAAERAEWRRKTAAYREEQHELARAITPQWASRVPLLREPISKNVSFLLGFPRSGTTLLDTFLMGHRQIIVLEEEQLVGKAAAGLEIKDLPTKSLAFLRQVRSRYLNILSKRVGDEFAGVVVDKFPLDMGVAPLIQATFPGAPIIFMQRHPCDVVLSGFMQTFGMVNFSSIEDAADYYDALMTIWTRSCETMELNVHTVIYEQLIEDPETVVRRAVEFLKLEWDPRILDHQRTARDRGTISTPSYDQVTEPISKAASGRWTRYREQMQPVLPLLLSWAERLGYKDEPPVSGSGD